MASVEIDNLGTWTRRKGFKLNVWRIEYQTTLVESITTVSASNSFLSKNKEIASPDSTIGVQTYEIQKLNALSKTDIVIWDFAGQLEYANNHQVAVYKVNTKNQYFLSSRNVVYLLVVDISLPLETQKEQIQYWLQYLQTQISNIEEIPIIIIGNKEDLVSSEISKQQSKDYFKSLQKKYSLKYLIVTANKSTNVKPLLEIIRKKCSDFLDQKDYFRVPSLYKKVGEYLKTLAESQVLIGLHDTLITQKIATR